MKPPSIKDIAKRAEVSITTVSFILNGKAEKMRISKEVIKRVEEIIQELGFKPNQVARSLRTGNTKTIGLIVEDISNPFFSAIARLIEDKAYKKGYKISYSSTENDPVKARELIEMFKSRKVDAYIIAPVPGIEEDIRQLLAERIPVVIFDRNLPDLDVNYVVVDNLEGGYSATEFLIKKGRKNIAFVTVDVEVDQINNRFLGYQKALRDHGMTANAHTLVKIPFDATEEDTNNRLKVLFEENPQIDAVFFSTNYLAVRGLFFLKSIQKPINDGFMIVAYDDQDVFRIHTPPISVVDQPIEQIAEKIIDIILQELSADRSLPQSERSKVSLPTRFIER
ncbi:LacI family transcriptional regulator [Pedobacter steynii]|uniref:LacI family transcriptional regulator n=1 Tax=Pedobacter steynii TaxID=430522 RepID=A0A1H0J590_9SPHI|nr:LacI family DNA-binding transcriptional regulator [Pedobacter steynii]NQX43030.1 LacI family DNA-binding transcriptional regulator [Pedobacter steynii]SDO38640.1 LacI family transcriptional regulator [Pedobacter steynii]